MFVRLSVALTTIAATVLPSAAQEIPYLDDRSTPTALVRSLYNAINRKEYARAWSYFGEQKPAASLEKFAEGYAKTTKVALRIGSVSAEGAAGSSYYGVPVAIEAYEGETSKVFTGCYTARLANPGIQSDAFQPLHLEKGTLAPGDSLFALPEKCGDGAAQPDQAFEQAKAAYAAVNAPLCDRADQATGLPDEPPENHVIKFKYDTDAATDPDREARLFSFECTAAAYNFSRVYYIYDEIDGVRQLQFAEPTYDVTYENPEDTENAKVEAITLNGFSTENALINSEYDPATKSITSYSKWRGIGDASSAGTWTFHNGSFVLKKYDVDASYDGEMNPQTLVDYDTAP